MLRQGITTSKGFMNEINPNITGGRVHPSMTSKEFTDLMNENLTTQIRPATTSMKFTEVVNEEIIEKEPIVEKYTVSFSLNGGEGTVPEDIEVDSGEAVTLPTPEVTPPEGYTTFTGWSTTDKAEDLIEGETYTPTKNITLYAIYEEASPVEEAAE